MILTREQIEERRAYLQTHPSDAGISGPLEDAYLNTIEAAWDARDIWEEIASQRKVIITSLQQQNTERLENIAACRQEMDWYRNGGLTEEILRRQDGYIKVGRGCAIISEQYLAEKDAEIVALRAERDVAIARSSRVGWQPEEAR